MRPTTIDRLGICNAVSLPLYTDNPQLVLTYNACWKAQASVEVPVKEDDQSSEQAMQGHWQYNGSVNGTLNEAKGKWPSSVYISIHIISSTRSWAIEPSRLLSG